MPRLLDLFCGRWGWSKAFAARGWECVGIDLIKSPEVPEHCEFVNMDVLKIERIGPTAFFYGFDFIVASSPCEQFSVHGMKHFHPNPPYPELGIKLFNHTREICEASGVPYVMENVRATQQFVGNAINHCGPFYLWGSGVPPLMPTGGIKKGISWPRAVNGKRDYRNAYNWHSGKSQDRKNDTAKAATIPSELANCVADYAERILEQRRTA